MVEIEKVEAGAGALPPIVPENPGGDFDIGEEFEDGITPILKPKRDEWVRLLVGRAIKVRLYARQRPGQSFQTDYYYVDPAIRRAVAGELRLFTVVPYQSVTLGRVGLLVVPAAEPGASGWGDSMLALLGKPALWHAGHAVRIRADRERGRYGIRQKPCAEAVTEPTEPTEALLSAALGADRYVRDVTHPVYLQMVEGEEI
jgi:hypothetical protein